MMAYSMSLEIFLCGIEVSERLGTCVVFLFGHVVFLVNVEWLESVYGRAPHINELFNCLRFNMVIQVRARRIMCSACAVNYM